MNPLNAAFKRLNGKCNFYILRHGRSDGNHRGVIQGQDDYPLSPEGEEQARKAGLWFRDKNLNIIVSSPLSRALHTAEIIGGETETGNPERNDNLKEIDTGIFTGLSFQECADIHPDQWRAFNQYSWEAVEGAEKISSLYQRALTFWEHAIGLAETGYRNILAVSHAGLIQWLIKTTFGSDDWMPLLPMSNCGIFHLAVDQAANNADGSALHPDHRFYSSWKLINYQVD
ncbi:MAG: histidine phosphatase family protein [Spirochaetales bacterium]|nr:histidine phosphatase family protein [Spirochaetales bacterium]MCF7938057.1 histidine phosphatase family protein [Spirochaetales bacterium]